MDHTIIRTAQAGKGPLLPAGGAFLPHLHLEFAHLRKGEERTFNLPGFESLAVVLTGSAEITAGDKRFGPIGQRKDIWSGFADSVYAGTTGRIHVKALADGTEVGITGGRCDETFEPFRVTPEEVEEVVVGSAETHSRRVLRHILGKNADGKAGTLFVSERYTDGGCWAGYPPHKHGSESGAEESAHDEIYHYRFNPGNGFGVQCWFDDAGDDQAFLVRTGDTFLFTDGYHPTVIAPGHTEYCFTVLYGRKRRSLVQNFKEEYRYQMAQFPGVQGMIDRYK